MLALHCVRWKRQNARTDCSGRKTRLFVLRSFLESNEAGRVPNRFTGKRTAAHKAAPDLKRETRPAGGAKQSRGRGQLEERWEGSV